LAAIWSPGDSQPIPDAELDPFLRMLDESILDFSNPRGFGYLKDRRHVAGFETHRFSQIPRAPRPLKVQSVELVSLLVHSKPAAYDSVLLPRMDELHGVPTRPLDRFEQFALEALREGEDIVACRVDDGARMLGAIRSVGQCVDCHGGRQGDMLGAFSYALRPADLVKPD
jgi:hypothetical protein